MEVPETPMHEYRFPSPAEHQVRPADNPFTVKSVPEAHPVHKTPHGQLRPRVPAVDGGHYLASLGRG